MFYRDGVLRLGGSAGAEEEDRGASAPVDAAGDFDGKDEGKTGNGVALRDQVLDEPVVIGGEEDDTGRWNVEVGQGDDADGVDAGYCEEILFGGVLTAVAANFWKVDGEDDA